METQWKGVGCGVARCLDGHAEEGGAQHGERGCELQGGLPMLEAEACRLLGRSGRHLGNITWRGCCIRQPHMRGVLVTSVSKGGHIQVWLQLWLACPTAAARQRLTQAFKPASSRSCQPRTSFPRTVASRLQTNMPAGDPRQSYQISGAAATDLAGPLGGPARRMC